ncbi:MAG: indolepyruvate oxidoreductase subunit beta [Deltaproteobacteria bacterium]|nr:indolepyruvate oxidoreductase subunit beta [Deltaproteobacteria bacterium]
MKYDIILAGVGGQGILTIAYMLDNAALARGYRIRQAEVHGMAQRGGAVYSHLRFSDREIVSDLIPRGQADMILSVEPLEVQRYLPLLHRDGVVVSSVHPFKNIPDYPDEKAILDALLELPRALLVDAKAIATANKMPRAENMAMLGAALPFLPFELADFDPFIKAQFERKGEHAVLANQAVLAQGFRMGMAVKERLDAGMPADAAYRETHTSL